MNKKHASAFGALLAFLFLVSPFARAVVDVQENGGTGDGIGDVWQLKYNAMGLAPNVDTDGDGRTNAEEAGAGTDPRTPSDIIEMRNLEIVGSDMIAHWPSQLGKRYKVQSTTNLTNAASWTEVTAQYIEGTGTELSYNMALGPTGTFYRVAVYDKDSDGDGVTDWEERQLGLDPENAYSHGSSGIPDLQWLTSAVTASSVLTVNAVDDIATEPASGSPASDVATFVINRTGGIKAVAVNFSMSGSATSGSDYVAIAPIVLGVGVNQIVVTVAPKADAEVESPEAAQMTLIAGPSYTLGYPSTAAVIIKDRTTATGNGLRARYYNEADTGAGQLNPNGTGGVPPTFATAVVSRIDATVDFDWPPTAQAGSTVKGVASPDAAINVDYFASRWVGEVLPEFSQIYTFSVEHNRCARLWVNGQLLVNKWPNNGDAGNNASGTTTGTIELEGGVRYPIVLEHFETTSDAEMHLRWSSANQSLVQIIPQNRLFADTAPQITSTLEVLLIKDSGLYNYQIVASASPTSYSAANLPPGWTINTSSGLISGNPSVAGEYLVTLTATNGVGSGSAVLRLEILATGGAIARSVWTNVTGTSISQVPIEPPQPVTTNIASLEGPQNSDENYGVRIRGYITAPVSGVYKFFLTGSDAAELYISDDDEPVNAFLRAAITGATGYRQWTSPLAGKSPLLILDAGRRYYVEVRHKAGAGADHVSVGWLKPGEGGVDPSSVTAPSEVIPGYVLSPYVPAAVTAGESSLFVTSLSSQGGALTSGYGSASLRLSADEAQAVLSFTYSNLTGGVTSKHIHSDAHGGEIIFDIDDFTPAADGSYTWPIQSVGAISASDVLNVIKTGQAYLNIHTAAYPNGEIRGNFRLAAASQTFIAPANQTWTDTLNAGHPESSKNRNAAARFITQATFGVSGADANANGNPDDIESVVSLGYDGWINDQFTKPIGYHYPFVFANRNQTDGQNGSYNGTMLFNSWWRNSILSQDQLRQRVAFALSQILVTSEDGPLDDRADALSDYYDMLLDNSFGNFRDILIQTTLHPAMGRYLDMLRNDKPNKSTGRIPNENYAREILQLFSVGLYRMHPDGSLVLNSKGLPVDTYDQNAIIGFAHVFTGWDYNYTGGYRTSLNAGSNWLDPMREVPLRHYTGQKRLLNNVVLPGLPVLNGAPLDPEASHSATEYNDPVYQALAGQELLASHDAIFNHPNVGPFVCRQLIQRLVSSNPSRGYLYRVVSKFNNNGSGVRGDMKAVIKAIFLDYEARSAVAAAGQGFGKQREPVSRVTAIARAFPAPSSISGQYSQSGSLVTVTTAVPHLYTGSPSIYVDFGDSTTGDAGQPLDATYSATVTGGTTFTLRTKSFETANYAQTGAITVFTTSGNGFFYSTGSSMYAEYLTGSPLPTNGNVTVGFRSSDELRMAVGGPTSKVGTSPSLATTDANMVLTVTAHGYANGSTVHLDFISNSATLPTAGNYVITATTTNTFTVARVAADSGVAMSGATVFSTLPANVPASVTSGTANLTRPTDFASRSGPIAVTYSDWNMASTDTELNQTPMGSPTVFNFYLPDYQFPGALATAGLTTPEFQITSETTVIRQANFIYGGLFNDSLGQSGLESFRDGSRDIMVDLRPWISGMNGGQYWSHNSNTDALINELNTRLMGGQLPAAARTIIKTRVQEILAPITSISVANPCVVTVSSHGLTTGDTVTISGVSGGSFTPSINGTFQVTVTGTNTFTVPVARNNNTTVTYTNAGVDMTPTNRRDRIRAAVHLIVTSPDFTIQK